MDRMKLWFLLPALASLVLLLSACGGGEAAADAGGDRPGASGRPGAGGPPSGGGRPGRGGPPGGFGGMGGFGGDAGSTAIPVEVAPVERRDISDYLETNGTLEAENEVDIVARIMGPIVELNVEEGMFVEEGEILARIDDRETLAQLEIARVSLEDARLAYERAKKSWEAEIIAKELLDQAKSSFDAQAAQIRSIEIQLGYTVIRAPFSGLIIERVIKNAEHVQNGARLFRISDFTPLLCEIQLPEKDLAKLRVGQRAYLTVEAFEDERFDASVLRVNPVVEAGTGTVRTTLSVQGRGKLRPGMFASVYLQVDRRPNALVIPKEALVLESIGDAVFVVADDVAQRREVTLGFTESDIVEITSGVDEGEQVVVIGQDSLSDGTAVSVLSIAGEAAPSGGRPGGAPRGGPASGEGRPPGAGGTEAGAPQGSPTESARPGRPGGGAPGRGPGPGFDPQNMTPEMEERIRARMKERGLTDEQIDERLEAMKSGNFRPGGPPGGRPGGPPSDGR